MHDVAREAGVSVATVDRVLNRRATVREATAKRVADAAHRIGYHASLLIEQRLRTEQPPLRMGFLLQKERQAFYRTFAQELQHAVDAAVDVRGSAVLRFSASQVAADVAANLREFIGEVDVLAATAINHPLIADAVRDLGDAGIPVFSLLSDYAQDIRIGYIGLNNLKIGRVAAWMLATAMHRPDKVAVFVGGHRWHGHELREAGFRNYFREYLPACRVLDTLVNLETRELTYEATLDLLGRHPDIGGIYVAGGGMEGAIAAVEEARQPGDIALVVNELTTESRNALASRHVTMVNATPLNVLCPLLITQMQEAVLGDAGKVSGQRFLEPLIYVPESV